jgi:hypothetical protein
LGYLTDTWVFDTSKEQWIDTGADKDLKDPKIAHISYHPGLQLFFAVYWDGGLNAFRLRPEALAAPAAPAGDQPAGFRMNPKLANVPDNTWVKMSPKFVGGQMPNKTEASLVYDESANRTLFFGGCGNGYQNNLWLYDCSGDVWTQANPDVFKMGPEGRVREDTKAVPPGCCSYGICYDREARVSILYRKNSGGSAWAPEGPGNNMVWWYAALKNKWIFKEPNGDRRPGYINGASLAHDPVNKESVLFGGYDNTLWGYKAETNAWRRIDVPEPRPVKASYPNWVYLDKEKRFFLFAEDATTWLFDPAKPAWEKLKPDVQPPQRQAAAIAYDRANNVAVMFGGLFNVPAPKNRDRRGDTWVFDPAKGQWQEVKPNPSPGPTQNVYQAAYDTVNNVTVLVTAGQTWVYRFIRPHPIPPSPPA